MVKAPLVGPDALTRQQILDALDAAALNVKVAVYLYADEYEDWRLFLASPLLDKLEYKNGPVHKAFEKAGMSISHEPTLMILPMSDPFIRELRKTWGKSPYAEGRRIGPESIGGRFIEDGIIYRVK